MKNSLYNLESITFENKKNQTFLSISCLLFQLSSRKLWSQNNPTSGRLLEANQTCSANVEDEKHFQFGTIPNVRTGEFILEISIIYGENFIFKRSTNSLNHMVIQKILA